MVSALIPGKKYTLYLWFIVPVLMLLALSFTPGKTKTGTLKITFLNSANGKVIELRDSLYRNAFGEEYSVNKLKYYVGYFSVPGSNQQPEADPYHLINAAADNSFDLIMEEGEYKSIHFLLGVDSASNCSGAQTGALDPMNDMFWTWNSGYVAFKLEGTSTSSTSDLQRIEHHIGGYKGNNNVSTQIKLDIPPNQTLNIKSGGITEIIIETNLDKYWKSDEEIKIKDLSICTTAGELAKKIAVNFPGLFSIRQINH